MVATTHLLVGQALGGSLSGTSFHPSGRRGVGCPRMTAAQHDLLIKGARVV